MNWIAHVRSGPQRVNHAAAAVGDRIFSFGGYCSTDMNLYIQKGPMDTFVLHTYSLNWREVPKASWSNQEQYRATPFLRYGHTAVAYGRKIYIWGGRNDHNACNRLYIFDTDTLKWSNPSTTGYIPSSRDGHSASIIGNMMYIFGGYEEEFEKFSQDIFSLNLDTLYWSYIANKGECPPYTDFHTGTTIGKRLYIFGGRSDRAAPNSTEADYYPNEIYYFDTDTNTWVKPMQFGEIPVGRRSHSAFVFHGKLYIFGGFNGELNVHYNDIYRYDPETSCWSRVTTFGKSPKRRRRQVCILIDDKLYLFGGTSPIENAVCYAHDQSEEDLQLREHELHLVDHDDLHVLDMSPSLKTLCMLLIIRDDICDHFLPPSVRKEIRCLKSVLQDVGI